jgi:type III pantothenate kinase
MNVLCIDVGNTNTRRAVVDGNCVSLKEKFPTSRFSTPGSEVGEKLHRLVSKGEVMGVAFCSVVPGIYPHLMKHLRIFTSDVFNLNNKTCHGLTLDYPKPSEIGQDRLANTIGAQARYGAPAIVIDMGTAVTLDILSEDRGYEGGVIAPGLALMSKYLHEKTALLPEVDPSDWNEVPIIGKSTREAIGIGCKRGFAGMITALVAPVYAELERRHGRAPVLISAGGDASFLSGGQFETIIVEEDITLYGLHEAFMRHQRSGDAHRR